MSLPVWVYWEGERPQWIAHCHETIKAHLAFFLALHEAHGADFPFGDLQKAIDRHWIRYRPL
jgi:hypothetical protein